jgi:hypothetical protein
MQRDRAARWDSDLVVFAALELPGAFVQMKTLRGPDELHEDDAHQIELDVARTRFDALGGGGHERLRRMLRLWAANAGQRSYTQGMNDLALPLLLVYPSERDTRSLDFAAFALFRMLNGYLAGTQPLLSDALRDLALLIQNADAELAAHLFVRLRVRTIDFAVPWIQCLLVREFTLECVLCVWDDLFESAGNAVRTGSGEAGNAARGLTVALLCVCAALLARMRAQLVAARGGDDALSVIKNSPTRHWTGTQEVRALLAEAYIIRSRFTVQ